MSNEYINKTRACNEMVRFEGYLDDDMICRLQIALYRIPAADVQEVKRGHWIQSNLMLNRSVCSVCKFVTDDIDSAIMKYCPNCGAKMDKEEDDAEVH